MKGNFALGYTIFRTPEGEVYISFTNGFIVFARNNPNLGIEPYVELFNFKELVRE